LSGIIWGLDYYANLHFLYWKLPWFDVMMHFLGGVLVAVLTLFVLRVRGVVDWKRIVVTVLLSLLVVGVAWEVFEYAMGVMDASLDGYVLDTTTDLIMDIFGMSVVLLVYKKLWTQNST